MARPRMDGDTPSAQERMREAFWVELEQRPYDQITVRGVVACAGVNKNAFYYHYRCLDDLAADALRHMLPPDLGNILSAQLASPSSGRFAQMLKSSGGNETLLRTRLVAGKHGSVALQQALKDMIWDSACRALDIQPDKASLDLRLTFEYVVGGAFSLWAYCGERRPEMTPEDVLETDFFAGFSQTMPVFLATLLQKQAGQAPAAT